MNRLTKEIIWSVVLLIISYLACNPNLVFPHKETSVDINIHDTYFVIESTNILILTILFVFFFTYLVRMISTRFRIITINSIFLLSNLLMIVLIAQVIKIIKIFTIEAGITIYPPLSAPPQIHRDNAFEALFYFFVIAEIIVVATFIFSSLKTIAILKRAIKTK
ncbi:hypothetical protein SGQ44_04750 [Flavobacterium sp. Fl-77]|uniref:Uncharacterized protein n=1 Tax=Flavobacterium flavipigmentatum TaxID=2893884 RepID=A0AAJ2W0F2_9FLAO|nr:MULTISPECIES: hypothetical protein [unclassified Flavobacterium]MDX6181916.1 hypothetical protein [Flavobacterium sp. Fl-33]MDX6185050.1 hypothetical protein [Flavobacterium sp. Fl-77]UFH37160.1 hypothetical protein LNP22_10480 [Flavobacterium sp. F-70]